MKEFHKILFNRYFILILILAILLRFIWFFTPLEIDEGEYAYFSNKLKDGQNIFAPEDEYTNKSPIIYFVYVIPHLIKDHSFIAWRTYGFLLYIISIFLFTKLAYDFSKNITRTYLAVIIYGFLMNIPIYQGFFNKVGIIYINFFMISFVFLLKYLEYKNNLHLIFYLVLYFITILVDPRNIHLSFFHIYYLYANKRYDLIKKTFLFGISTMTGIIIFSFVIYKVNLVNKAIMSIIYILRFYTNFPYQHNIHLPYIPIFILQSSFLIFISLFSIHKYSKLTKHYQNFALFCFIFMISIFILPSYGHYVLNIIPLLALLGSYIINKYWTSKKFLILLIIVAGVNIISSLFFYPNMKIESIGLSFGSFSSLQSQSEIIKFLNTNLEMNESFFYYGFNKGNFWLANRDKSSISCSFQNPIYGDYANEIMESQKKTNLKKINSGNFKFLLAKEEIDLECLNYMINKTSLLFVKKIGTTSIYEIQ